MTGALRSDVCGGTSAARARATGRATDGGAALWRFPRQTSAREHFFGGIITVISSFTILLIVVIVVVVFVVLSSSLLSLSATIERGVVAGTSLKNPHDKFYPRQLSLGKANKILFYNFFADLPAENSPARDESNAPPTWR